MRVPQGISLGAWIRELIAQDKLYRFYKTEEWLTLREQVMSAHHWECVRCKVRGEYSKADTVHHEYEVRKHPEMALTRYLEQLDGTLREVLHPLCNRCHNDIHGRTLKGSAPKNTPITEERWD